MIDNRSNGIRESVVTSALSINSDNSEDEQSARHSQNILKTLEKRKVSSNFVEFALKKVQQYNLSHDHGDIDRKSDPESETNEDQWNEFIEEFYAAAQ